jgi:hypothetical protein
LAKKKFHTRIGGRTLRVLLRQASLPEECLSKSEEECKLLWTEAKDAFERFKPTAAKVAEEMRRDLGKRIANRKGTDLHAKFKKAVQTCEAKRNRNEDKKGKQKAQERVCAQVCPDRSHHRSSHCSGRHSWRGGTEQSNQHCVMDSMQNKQIHA